MDNKTKSNQVVFYYLQKEPEYGSECGVVTSEIRQISGFRDDYVFSLYLQGPSSQVLLSPFPRGVSLISIAKDGTTLELTLSSEFTSLQGYSLTLAYACIAHTAASVYNADAVHIIAEGENAVVDTVVDTSMFLLKDDADLVTESIDK